MSDINSRISISDGFSKPLSELANKVTNSAAKLGGLGMAFDKVEGLAAKGKAKLNDFAETDIGGHIVGGISSVQNRLSGLVGQVHESSNVWDDFYSKMNKIEDSKTIIETAKGEMAGFAKQTIYNDSEMATAYTKLAESGMKATSTMTKSLANLASETSNPKTAFSDLSSTVAGMANKPKIEWEKFEGLLKRMPSEMDKVASAMNMATADMAKDAEQGKLKTETFMSGLKRAGGSGTIKPPNNDRESVSPQMPRSNLLSWNKGGGSGLGIGKLIGGNIISSGIIGTVGAVTNGIHSMAQELDESTKAWATFDGNMHQIGMPQNKINAARNDMQKYAQDTIYSSSDMASTYSQLAATGTKNTSQLVKGFGGLAAASSDPKQAMKTLSQQGTQMAAKPMIQWQDFKLMMEQTPAGISAVAKSMHMSTSQMMQDVQKGKIKTQDFFDAVAHTGTNKTFSAMATHYKTVGQALDGTRETLANKIQPAWADLSGVVINAISKINDGIGNLNFDDIAKKAKPYLQSFITGFENTASTIGRDVKGIWDGLMDTGAIQNAINIVNNIKGAFSKIMPQGKKNDPLAPFRTIGKFAGDVIKGISNLAGAIKGLDTNDLMVLAGAFFILKASTRGLVLTGVVVGLQMLSKLDTKQLHSVAVVIGLIAVGLAAFKVYKGFTSAIQSIKSLKSVASKKAFSDISKGAGESALSFIKLGAGLLLAGGGMLLAGAGLWIIADASIRLADAGWPAVAVMGGMIAALGILAVVVAIGGSAMMAGSVGFLIFGAAVLLVGAGVWLATEGTAALAAQLPTLASDGLAGAGALVVLGAALIVFSAFALIAAVGVAVLGVGLVVLGAGALVAAVGVLALGAAGNVLAGALVGVGAGLMVAAAGIQAMKDAITGNFSGAKEAISSTKDSVSGLKDTIGSIGKGAGKNMNLGGLFGGISASADSTKNHVNNNKMTPQVDNSQAVNQLNSLGDKKVKSPKMDNIQLPNNQNIFEKLNNQSQNQTVKSPKVEQPKMAGNNGDLLSSLQSQMNGKNLTAPKVNTPKVPNPQMPKNVGTIAAPKVAKPKTPAPTLPKNIGTIPAPKVAKPNMSGVISAVKSGMNSAVSVVKGTYGTMYSAGSYVGQGLANGIRSQISNVASAANDLIAQADRAARAKAKIHSPSRLFAEIGDYIGQGMANGMNGTTNLVTNASGNLNDAAVGGIDKTIDAPTLKNGGNLNPPKNDHFSSGNGLDGGYSYNNRQQNNTNDNSSSNSITIENGAIQIISHGNEQEDIESLMRRFENYLRNRKDGRIDG